MNMPYQDPKEIVEKVKDDYNLIAKEWDQSRNRPSQIKIDLVSDIPEGATVLDIGCGNGLMLSFLLEKDIYYTGVDIAENLIDIAQERYAEAIESGRARFVTGEATELPVKDAEYDYVISFAVLHHLPSPLLHRKFFDEIRRVLRPNGHAKITVWNLCNDWAKGRFDIESQLEGKISGDVTVPWKGTHGAIVNRYVHQFSLEELRALAEGAGFSDICVDYFNRAGERVENGEEIVLEMKK